MKLLTPDMPLWASAWLLMPGASAILGAGPGDEGKTSTSTLSSSSRTCRLSNSRIFCALLYIWAGVRIAVRSLTLEL